MSAGRKIKTMTKTAREFEIERMLHRMNDPKRGGRGDDVGPLETYYTIGEELGRGAFAVVRSGVEKATGREVALKIVSLDNSGDDKRKKSKINAEKKHKALRQKVAVLEQEVEILRKIMELDLKRRKGVVELYDVIATPESITLVEELLSGGELFDRVLTKRHYSERDAALILKRVIRAVRHLHRAHIVHRDLKPENLVFATPEEDSSIKITDFGLAYMQSQRDIFENLIVGSPGYLAPEVLTRRQYLPACDIWSMGCILYILLVGGPPFGGRNDAELFENIKSGRYGYPKTSRISALAKDLVAKMLTVDPAFRISASAILNHPWLVQGAASADLNNAVQRLRGFNSRKKLKALAMALVWSNESGDLQSRLREILRGTSHENGLSGEELTLLRNELLKFRDDAAGKDVVNFDEFSHACANVELDDLPLEDLFALFANDTEEAEIAEICLGLATVSNSWTGVEALKFAFTLYERDGSGKISTQDLDKIMRMLFGERYTYLSDGLSQLVNAFVPTSVGGVSFEEFRNRVWRTADPLLEENIFAPVRSFMRDASSAIRRSTMMTWSLVGLGSRIDSTDNNTEDSSAEENADNNNRTADISDVISEEGDGLNHLGEHESNMVYESNITPLVDLASLVINEVPEDDEEDED